MTSVQQPAAVCLSGDLQRLICTTTDQDYDISKINKILETVLQSTIMSFLFTFVKYHSRAFSKQRANGKHTAEPSCFLIDFVCTYHIYYCKSGPVQMPSKIHWGLLRT